MKIVSINTHDQAGGAAKVALSLHREYIRKGHQAKFLVHYKALNDPNITWLNSQKIDLIRRFIRKLEKRFSIQYLLDPSFFLINDKLFKNIDVIHLHNIHGSYFNPLILPSLSHNYLIIWTLHEMWALTGRCTNSLDCEHWKSGCGGCPTLHEYPALQYDTSSFHWKVKRAIYRRSNLSVVVPSLWLKGLAEKSILRESEIYHIPHGVDTTVFKPIDRQAARRRLKLPEDGTILLFSAIGGASNPYKGFKYLADVLRNLNPSKNSKIVLVIIGDRSAAPIVTIPGCTIVEAGRIGNEELMACYYASADLFLFPSLAESFGLVALEAMSCGTPVLAFKVGGIPDFIDHMQTGYVASEKDSEDFARGIHLFFNQPDLFRTWGWAARDKVLKDFTLDIQSRRYLELITEKLDKNFLS